MKTKIFKIAGIMMIAGGIFFSCGSEDDNDMSKIDLSNIEDLYAQPLPVIQACVQGKWKWYASYGGFTGVDDHENTFVEIYDEHYLLTDDNGRQTIVNFTWEKYPVIREEFETWVMKDKEYERAWSWYFISIKNDTLRLGRDIPPNARDVPSGFEFIRMK